MGWLRRSEQAAVRTDPLASWGQRIWNVVLVIFGPSALMGLAVGAYGWITANLLYGIAFGFSAFALIQAGLTLRAIRQSARKRGPFAEPSPEEASEVALEHQRLAIPEHMISDRHISYHSTPIRLADLLEVAGVDGAIMGFTFEHCILEGSGIITFRGPPPAIETEGKTTGGMASAMVGPTNCRVEGSPDTTLYEIRPDGIKRLHGVIQLVGPTIRDVTFRNLGFAGTSDELRSLRKQLTFSDGNGAASVPPSINTTAPQTADQADDEALRQRCLGLADKLYRFLAERGHGEVEVDDPDDLEMRRRNDETIGLYRRHGLEGEVMALSETLRQRGMWGDEILDPFGRNRLTSVAWYGDIRSIAQRLSTIGHKR